MAFIGSAFSRELILSGQGNMFLLLVLGAPLFILYWGMLSYNITLPEPVVLFGAGLLIMTPDRQTEAAWS